MNKSDVDQNDSNIVYQLLPKFNFVYKALSTIYIFILLAFGIYVEMAYNRNNETHYVNYKIYFIIMAILFIFMIIYYFLEKEQFKKIKYDFYSYKYIYTNDFCGKYIKEIKYKDIEDVFVKQNIIQKILNVGTIKMITKISRLVKTKRGINIVKDNVSINSIENAQKEYEKIIEIVDNAKYNMENN